MYYWDTSLLQVWTYGIITLSPVITHTDYFFTVKLPKQDLDKAVNNNYIVGTDMNLVNGLAHYKSPVQKVMGSTPDGDSVFFLIPCLCRTE